MDESQVISIFPPDGVMLRPTSVREGEELMANSSTLSRVLGSLSWMDVLHDPDTHELDGIVGQVGVHHRSASPLRLAGETAVCGTLATPTLYHDGRLPMLGRDVRKAAL
ncbi:unnamed protein product [Arctogadus glacialis]